MKFLEHEKVGNNSLPFTEEQEEGWNFIWDA